MLKEAKDDKDTLCSYEEWEANAEETIIQLKNDNFRVYKINIDCDDMFKWFKFNSLENDVDSREEYLNYKLQKFLKDPIIN